MDLNNELKGIVVLSIEQAVSAPYCGMLLAEAGARVIKVERPEGDFARGYDSGANGKSAIFAWLNRGKESICLDLNKIDDISLIRRILKRTDIFLNNLTSGTLQKKGLSFDQIKELNPQIINCSISGYGSTNKMSTRKAYDFLIQGEVGLCSVTGTTRDPCRVGISIADLSTGSAAFSAILRGIIQRDRTGCGVNIELSMFGVLSEWMNMPLISYRYSGRVPQRRALGHSFVAPYGAFETKDKKNILLSIQNDREWRVFCVKILENSRLVNDPKFKSNVARFKNKKQLNKIIERRFKEKTKRLLARKLTDAKIAFSNLNSIEELANHELLKNKEIHFADTKVSVADVPLSNKQSGIPSAPSLNQHDLVIRSEFKECKI